MSEERPEYLCCIRKGETAESLCGRKVPFEFCFVSLEHAQANEKRGGRLVACPECMKAALEIPTSS